MSYVIARKRIADLRRVNQKKEWLVEKIFSKISLDRGIKMKDLFRMMLEELQDIIKVQSCSLFAVGDDGKTAALESGWPEEGGYHGYIDETPTPVYTMYNYADVTFFGWNIAQKQMKPTDRKSVV